jgi:hypothetical protein
MKVIKITDEGFAWLVPLSVVAEHRAKYYADGDETAFKDEVDHVMNFPAEGVEWFLGNMDFSDVRDHAKLVEKPEKTAPNSETWHVDDDEVDDDFMK